MRHSIYFNQGRKLSRRTMLRSAGVAMSLPWLSAMERAFAGPAETQPPRRFVAMTLGLGLLGDNLNPKESGRDYAPSLYLKQLQDLRDHFTVISGSSHPGVKGGHRAEASLLTAQPMGSGGQAKNTISLDQYLAKHLGHATRFGSLVLGSSGSNSPSYTENGSMIPAEDSPSRLFTKLFIDDTPAEQARQAQRLQEGRSILDLVQVDSKRLARQLGGGDRDRLDAYFTSVRDLESRLAASQDWATQPKPKVDAKKPVDIGNSNDFVGREKLMTDMIRLTLKTDSARFITYHLGGSGGVVPIDGVKEGYHSLSHHGRDEMKLEQLALVETAIIAAWGEFPPRSCRRGRPRMQLAGSNGRVPDQQFGERLQPRQPQHARPAGRRRLPPRSASGLRPAEQLSAAQSLRQPVAAIWFGSRPLRHQHRNAERAGTGRLIPC